MKTKKDIEAVIREEMPEFYEAVAGLSVADLDARLAQIAKDKEALEDAQDADEGLQEARDTARGLNAPYVDGRKAIKLKSKYIIQLIKNKGGA